MTNDDYTAFLNTGVRRREHIDIIDKTNCYSSVTYRVAQYT